MGWKWSKKQHESQLAAVQQSKKDKHEQIVQQFAEHGPASPDGVMSFEEMDAFVQQAMDQAMEKWSAVLVEPKTATFQFVKAKELNVVTAPEGHAPGR
ncbi:hypothetical protein [Lentzea sp. NBRC 102530]|uniref:hypothetical protein n=1 Tax=Lentzea sp. NBRC 102530 TaxID=3032201 RepID=UPI0024A39352|nr:hypothetical protein [Lentzea sp. NBRC 102530]GLY55309.1 hypothetical protein Lesp01_89640 [Lentzea sp. NBRC 102530]